MRFAYRSPQHRIKRAWWHRGLISKYTAPFLNSSSAKNFFGIQTEKYMGFYSPIMVLESKEFDGRNHGLGLLRYTFRRPSLLGVAGGQHAATNLSRRT